MDTLAIFGLQFFLSLVVWGLIAKWLLAPWLEKKSPHEALFWLTLPHAFRHIGMVFLVPGVVAQTLPESFAALAAYGDLVTGVLALLALIALRTGWRGTLALVWVFNIVGTVDLLNALRHANAVPDLGAAWYIPTFFVPLLLVTHFMMFARLLRRGS
ncbi:MAG: hypothetical protein IH830_05930 [Planctomycetes bacterium]|nr:hypothetical protein [Planctomycetota bacterium]